MNTLRKESAQATTNRNLFPQRVAISYVGGSAEGDFDRSFADGLQALHCHIEWVKRDDPLPPDADLILGYGPFNVTQSMLYAGRQLERMPGARRPLFAWWLTEGIPARNIPAWVIPPAAAIRVRADDLARASALLRNTLARLGMTHAWNSGHRVRVFGELQWLKARGLPDILVVTSESRAAFLQARGFDPLVAPLGYDPAYGTDLRLKRDIPAAFLGNTAAPRRQQLLPPVERQLAARHIPLVIQNDLYGRARTEFLNRTRVLINILRAPQDHVGQRLMLGAANKTLIISEPVPDNEPFIPGKHFVVAPLDKLAETVAYYLEHENERTRITEAAYALVTQELTATRMVERILTRAREIHARRLATA